ncbi:MAG TPA: CPBP family intramembrane glutamic endopeptidase [Candidatus Angelobacter sp.]|nr:CPBP family intramembrane glutamic endopeptidase [Candidatus Angelobacter sp.]
MQLSKRSAVAEVAVGFVLIEATVWSSRPVQRYWFWAAASWFLLCTILAVRRQGCEFHFRLPRFEATAMLFCAPVFFAGVLLAHTGAVNTAHRQFGIVTPLFHASAYLFWAVVQQYLQQAFFFARLEHATANGVLAGFLTASLFALAHIPNPVLTPVTFAGGWFLSELFRRYRSIVPLGILHGLTGMAIALTVPDHLLHHMRVGLSYLTYPH